MLLGSLWLAAASVCRADPAQPLVPARHADFTYYTFALTWQPGICGTAEGCTADQPTGTLIGLHGLWASLPQTLAAQGIVAPQWWQHGCDYFAHSDAAPDLGPELKRQLGGVMPHFAHDLLTHEYDKHVQCFGFDATAFFATELRMREAVADSPFGDYLRNHAGADVTHQEILTAFGAAFHPAALTSLQLQCGTGAGGAALLTQLWISVDARQLEAFPAPRALIDAPIAQDDCPGTFRLPNWPAPA